ncbi:MAG: hypothetical protein LW808_002070 [Verrucomicrobiota bacterium]|nr:MAG: hypothetical protein LW808_002070 [Verrucomicrobiota bacterium]
MAAEENPNIGRSNTLSTIKQPINIGIKLIKGDRAAIEKKLNLYERSFQPTTNGIFGTSKLQFVRSEYDVIKAEKVANATKEIKEKHQGILHHFKIH